MSDHMDSEAVMSALQAAMARDKPSDPYAYMANFAKSRMNVTALTPIEQAVLLCDAAASGNLAELRSLLDKGINANASDYDHRTALHLAADNGKLDIVRQLIESGATVDVADRWQNTPYSGAVAKGYAEVAEYLKSKGAKPSTLGSLDDGATQMCAAAGSGNLAKVRDLADRGVALDASDYDDRSGLHLAAEEGHLEVVKHMVENGVNPNLQDRWGTTPLSGAENNDHSEIAAYLRSVGGKRTGEMALRRKSSLALIGASEQLTALIKAASTGDVSTMERLIGDGVDVNQGDYDRRCPLHLAAEEGQLEAVRLLIECGADVNAKDRWGTTPLKGAIRNTHNDIADFLKDHGAQTDKFQEPRSYHTNLRSVRNFFEAIQRMVSFPASEVLPVPALSLRLFSEYGFNIADHEILRAEVAAIARNPSDEEVQQFIGANPAAKEALDEFHLPSFQDSFEGKVFIYDDLADLVLHVHSEHDMRPGTRVEESMSLMSEIVLDKLRIHNWEAFSSNLRALFEEVLQTPNDGENAGYIPELRDAPSDRFALSICTVHGQRLNFGDTDNSFSVQSVGKTFAYTRALQLHGHEAVHKCVGQEPSGRAFNDFALTRQGTPFNPVTNAGAIVTCSFLEPDEMDIDKRLMPYKNFVSEMSGGMEVGDCLDVYRSEQECAFRNYALANFMRAENTFPKEIDTHEKLSASVEFYLRVCAAKVSAPLLANVAATYANYGVSPLTGKVLMTETEVKQTLQILASCGMYDYSGEWACKIGMPAKSGVSGEIFVVVPGVLGMCVWSPKLDAIGNSVRGIRLCERFAQKFRFSVLDLLFRAKEE